MAEQQPANAGKRGARAAAPRSGARGHQPGEDAFAEAARLERERGQTQPLVDEHGNLIPPSRQNGQAGANDITWQAGKTQVEEP